MKSIQPTCPPASVIDDREYKQGDLLYVTLLMGVMIEKYPPEHEETLKKALSEWGTVELIKPYQGEGPWLVVEELSCLEDGDTAQEARGQFEEIKQELLADIWVAAPYTGPEEDPQKLTMKITITTELRHAYWEGGWEVEQEDWDQLIEDDPAATGDDFI